MVDDVYFGICLNTNPYTYLGTRPLNLAPETNLDTGLTMMSVRSLELTTIVSLGLSALASGDHLRGSRSVDYRTDLAALSVEGYGPFPYQVDGDYLGEVTELEFRHEPGALALVLRNIGSPVGKPPFERFAIRVPPRERLAAPRQDASIRSRATSGTLVMMPSTPSPTSSAIRAGSSTVHEVDGQALRVGRADERGVDQRIPRVDRHVAGGRGSDTHRAASRRRSRARPWPGAARGRGRAARLAGSNELTSS